jgi:hypothetical protein
MYRRKKLQQERLRLRKVQTSKTVLLKNKFFLEEGNRMLYMGVYSILLYFTGRNCIIYAI